MRKTLLTSWPLFFGLSMIMVGNGLQGTLLGVRATIEHFPTYATGIIMSMYFVGYMAGSHYVPKLIRGVGHIRVFAALASLASTTVLFHALFPNETAWMLIRCITGFSYAGLYIVIESWLNNAANNQTRGKMMALYLVILYSSMAVGQYLLNVADPAGASLFIIVSILITIAVLPISLSSRPAPHFPAPAKVSAIQLFKASPLGIYGVFASGMASACLWSIGPVYAAGEGFSLPEISTFIASAIVGGVLFQFPVGWLSDKYDRRRVLICMAAATAILYLFALVMSEISHIALFFAMFLSGGTALTIYGLSTAHTNDRLTSDQIVAASAAMIMINGIGAVIGPILSSTLMNWMGSGMLFVTMAVIYGSIAGYGIYRTSRRAPAPNQEQAGFIPTASPSTMMVMQQSMDSSAPEQPKSL